MYKCWALNTLPVNGGLLWWYLYDEVTEYIAYQSWYVKLIIYSYFGVNLFGDMIKNYFSIVWLIPNHWDSFNIFSFIMRMANSMAMLDILLVNLAPFLN